MFGFGDFRVFTGDGKLMGTAKIANMNLNNNVPTANVIPIKSNTISGTLTNAHINLDSPLFQPSKIRMDINFLEEASQYVKHSKKKLRIEKKLILLYKELSKY